MSGSHQALSPAEQRNAEQLELCLNILGDLSKKVQPLPVGANIRAMLKALRKHHIERLGSEIVQLHLVLDDQKVALKQCEKKMVVAAEAFTEAMNRAERAEIAERSAFDAGMNAKRGRVKGPRVWRISGLCSPEETEAAYAVYLEMVEAKQPIKAAQALGRKGGQATAKKLTKQQRSASAKKAAMARWAKDRKAE